MTMSPDLRKVVLTLHLTASVGWIGSVAAFLALAVVGVRSTDERMLRGAYLAMNVLFSYVIVPLAFGGLLTGLVSSLGTTWGLFRHYWVLLKLVLTVVAIVVLLKQVEPIRDLATLAADSTASVGALPEARRPLIHAAGGLVVLLVIQVLGVYKPRGLTRYGWRKQVAAKLQPPQ
jgi:hypothetical protein